MMVDTRKLIAPNASTEKQAVQMANHRGFHGEQEVDGG